MFFKPAPILFSLTFGVFFCFQSPNGFGKQAKPTQPNIVYINVDDLGWTDLSCQGSKFYKTPNIDRLASQGMRFTNAYAPAANCAPSRACCLTGQYTPRHGVYTVASSERGAAKNRKLIPTKNTRLIKNQNHTIAHALKRVGYTTATVGKWHISKDPRKNGFDINIAGGHWGSPSRGGYHSPYDYPNCQQSEKGEYLTDRLTDEAIKFVIKNKDKPFFLYLPFYTVHSPLQAKPKLRRLYADANTTKDQATSDRASKGHNNKTYAAMIHSMDENVGRLLQTLERLKLSKNTIVVFTSDNGGVWNTSKQWPLRAGKGSYYEGGIREPLIFRWPGKIKAGSRCDVPVCGIDLFPTFLEMAGAKKPKDKILDGLSLIPLLEQNGTLKDRALFWHFPIYLQGGNKETTDPLFRTRPGSVVRLGDWKLHEYFEEGSLELYNLAEDIGETKNLAKKNPAKVRQLLGMLRAWRKETAAPVPKRLNPKFQSAAK